MKKHILSTLVIITMFTACKKDDINENPGPVTLVGTWKLTAWKSANAYDLNGDGTTNTNLLNEFDCYHNELIIFDDDRTGIMKNSSSTNVIATLVTGTENTYTYAITCIQEQDNSFFNWSRPNENTIAISESDETYNLNLNGNKISFLVDEFVVATDDSTTSYPVIIEDLIFVYTKQ